MGNQKIILKKSAVQGKVPLPADLEIGEVAINTYDARLYTKHSDGSVKEVSPSETGTSIATLINNSTTLSDYMDDGDRIPISGGVGNALAKITWQNFKAVLVEFLDTVYASIVAVPVKATGTELNSGTDDAKFATAKALKDGEFIAIHVGTSAPSDTTKLWLDTN